MCGNKNTTTTSTSAPSAAAMSAYNDILSRAGTVANTPYTPYGGEFTAPVNQQQNLGISGINTNASFAQPYIGQAANYANAAAAPITGNDIAQYQSPFTQQVVNATQAEFNNQNQQQQSTLTGNAAARGALGGDRVGVAQGILAGQQSLAQAPVIAGLENTGFANAQQMALAQRQNLGNAAYSLGNLGVAGQNAALSGASAQVGAGSLQQQTQQAGDTAAFQEFLRQQAYPFQTTQWLAGLDTGVGSQMGGTSSTTAPPPNPFNSILGLGTAAIGAFAKDGGRIKGFALGGAPWSDAAGYVPTMSLTPGSGAPKPPGTGGGTQPGGLGNLAADAKLGKGLGNLWDKFSGSSGPTDYAYSAPAGLGDFSPTYMEGFGYFPTAAKRGGAVHRDVGGPITQAGFGAGSLVPASFDERFNLPTPAVDPAAYNLLQDYGASLPGYDDDTGRAAPHMADLPLPRPRPPIAGLDTGDLPPEITGGSGPPAAPAADDASASAYAPSTPTAGLATGDDTSPRSGGLLSRIGLNLSPEAKMGLIAAGLGMMASRSPYLGQAIGEGGLQGLNTYAGQQKEARAEKKSQADIEHGRDQLAQAAKIAADRLAQAREFHNTITPYQQAQLDRENLKPTGTTTDEGHPILFDTRRGGQAIDGITGQPIKADQKVTSTKTPDPSFTTDELKVMARQYMAGDKSVLTNLGRGAQGASDLKALRKAIVAEMGERGISPEAQAVKMAEFQGMTAGQRALGTRTANIEMAANEARNMMKPALDLSEKIARTNWTPVNRAIQAFERGTSDPDLAAWGAANFSLVNTYVRAIAPTGVPPESARNHALSMLNTAMGHEAYKRVVGQMDIEMKAALDAPEQVKEKFRKLYGGVEGAPAAGAAPAAASAGLSAQDQQALDWASKNPADPRAAAIKKRLGVP